MDRSVLDEFIQYAREQFDCGIVLEPCGKPDTFESVFGASFLWQTDSMAWLDEFEDNLQYKNVSAKVRFETESGPETVYGLNISLAA